jgi:protein SCO1/2
MNARAKWFSVVIVCAFGLAGAAAALFWRHHPAVELATGASVAPSRALPDFSLIDHHGRNFGEANLRGHWSIMFFGYTNCPDFCPTTLSTLAALEQRLRVTQGAVLPQVLFVSVDAKRDTPEQLARYVPYFDPTFIGLTAADQPSIEAVAAKLGALVVITPLKDGTYTVDHSANLLVLDPRGRLAAILTGPFTVPTLAADWQRITAGSS